MKQRVGQLCGTPVGPYRVEWQRIISVNPVKYGAIICVTKIGDPLPEKVKDFDSELACRVCEGSGEYVPGMPCKKCKGTGKRIHLPPQKPRTREADKGINVFKPH